MLWKGGNHFFLKTFLWINLHYLKNKIVCFVYIFSTNFDAIYNLNFIKIEKAGHENWY